MDSIVNRKEKMMVFDNDDSEKSNLIEQLKESLEAFLCSDSLSDEEKILAIRKARQIIEGNGELGC